MPGSFTDTQILHCIFNALMILCKEISSVLDDNFSKVNYMDIQMIYGKHYMSTYLWIFLPNNTDVQAVIALDHGA